MESNGMVKLPNGKIAYKAIYSEQVITNYSGNPMIEALPPILSREDLYDKLSNYPDFHETDKTLDNHYRYKLANRLKFYFQPLEKHHRMAEMFDNALREGYLTRNPLSDDYLIELKKGHKIINNGGYVLDATDKGNTSAGGFIVIGVSGTGKSSAMNHVLKLYPQVVSHGVYNGYELCRYQLTYLKLDCPHDGVSVIGLCTQFFMEVDKLLGTNYQRNFGRNTETKMVAQMQQVARIHSLGTLIIDEVQNLNIAKKGASEKMINFFVSLVNMIGIPVILIGTSKALSIVQSKFREARRATGDEGDIEWDPMENNRSWKLLLKGMFKYDWTRNGISDPDDLSDALYDESQGIVDVAVKLYRMAQARAIKTKTECITPELVRTIANTELKIIRPMILALKNGDPKALLKYDDIRPLDIQRFLDKNTPDKDDLAEAALMKKAEEEQQRRRAESLDEYLTVELHRMKIEKGIAKKAIATLISQKGEHLDKAKALKEAIRIVLTLEGEKEQKQEEVKIKRTSKKGSAHDPRDLRVIVAEGKKKKLSALQALEEYGYHKDPLDILCI